MNRITLVKRGLGVASAVAAVAVFCWMAAPTFVASVAAIQRVLESCESRAERALRPLRSVAAELWPPEQVSEINTFGVCDADEPPSLGISLASSTFGAEKTRLKVKGWRDVGARAITKPYGNGEVVLQTDCVEDHKNCRELLVSWR